MAGLFDFNYEDPQQVGQAAFGAALLNAGGPSRMPISTGQAIGHAIMARQQAAAEAQQSLRRDQMAQAQIELARAHAANYMKDRSNAGMPANVRTAMWYADPARTPEEKAAFQNSVRSQPKQMIGDVLYVQDYDTREWRPANPLEQQLSVVSQGAFAKTAGAESAKATYDTVAGVDQNNRDVFSTRADQLRNMGVPMRGAPGAPPQYMPPPQVTAPQLLQGAPQAGNPAMAQSPPEWRNIDGYVKNQQGIGQNISDWSGDPGAIPPGDRMNPPPQMRPAALAGAPMVNQPAPVAQAGPQLFRPPAAGNAARAQAVQEADKVGQFQGDLYTGFVKSGVEAQQTINKLDRFEQLLSGVDTGKLTPIGTEVAGYLKSVGIDIDPNLPNKQAANSLTNELALMLRKPGKESGGMPGNFSDQDRNFLTKIVPSLANTPGGNQMIIQLARKIARRDTEMADLAETYRTQNGSMDGFAKVQRAYSASHPLFPKEAPDAASAAQPAQQQNFTVGERRKTKDGRDVEFDGTGWKLVQ